MNDKPTAPKFPWWIGIVLLFAVLIVAQQPEAPVKIGQCLRIHGIDDNYYVGKVTKVLKKGYVIQFDTLLQKNREAYFPFVDQYDTIDCEAVE